MAKKESTFLNMVLTLFIVTGVSAVSLGLVYNVTKGPIEEAKLQKLNESIEIVVPDANIGEVGEEFSVPAIDGGEDLLFYKVKVDGKLVGTAIRTYTNMGFSGYMSVMVGLDPDGIIIDSNILEHRETPGLGDKTCKSVSPWNNQYIGLNPAQTNLKVKKDGGDVDGITAATITARAYSDAIQRAYDTYMKYLENKSDNNNGGEDKLLDNADTEELDEILLETNDLNVE